MNYYNYTDEYKKPISQTKLLICLLIVGIVVLLGLIACLIVLLVDDSDVSYQTSVTTSIVQSTENNPQNLNENNYVVKNEGGRFYDTGNSVDIGSGNSGTGSGSKDDDDSQSNRSDKNNPSDDNHKNESDSNPDSEDNDNRDDKSDGSDNDRRNAPDNSSDNPSSTMQGYSMVEYLGLTLEQLQQGMNCGYSLIDPYEGTINGVMFSGLPFEFYFYSHDGYMGEPRPTEQVYMVYFDSSTSNKMLVDDNFTSHSTYGEICSEGNGELVENHLDGGYIYVHQGDGYNVSFLWLERPSDNKTPDTICVTQQIN